MTLESPQCHFSDEILSREEVQGLLKTQAPGVERQNLLKMLVGWEIAERVLNGDRLGIGSGTTAKAAIRAIGQRLLSKEDPLRVVHGVATSRELAELARSVGIDVEPFDDTLQGLDTLPLEPDLDWGFDGADEVEVIRDASRVIKRFRLIKGYGGAQTIEKLIARRCKKWRCIVDESKRKDKIGAFAIAVEVWEDKLDEVAKIFMERYGATAVTRRQGFITDQENCILDVQMQAGAIQVGWEQEWNQIDGVIDNGIFDEVQPAEVLVAHADGTIESLKPGDVI
ncbi:ribose 5-phosphate isomerase A [Candidatus Gottesmanbacteria bacterium RBG_13_45_10]|uniref:Ribose 5-phosphate isomerase A n=1 Tax=Candidatus Gottesmanbacteria bacterium RBG_13_45_10 TaxID=1798370 RepID=A0A1F5ZGY8_9BACT|nr:MAG: ribose 5-phosphate isomerase A [Candidatus Gottesmanbacteria bacterium RBG_13_45_10]